MENKSVGLDGEMLAQRIEGDLQRLMNSAWLNCSDLIHRHESNNQSTNTGSSKNGYRLHRNKAPRGALRAGAEKCRPFRNGR